MIAGEQNTEKHAPFILSTIMRKLRELFGNSDLKGKLWEIFMSIQIASFEKIISID